MLRTWLLAVDPCAPCFHKTVFPPGRPSHLASTCCCKLHKASWLSLEMTATTIGDLNALQWRHNGRDGVSNFCHWNLCDYSLCEFGVNVSTRWGNSIDHIHQPHDCLLNPYSGTDERKHKNSASLAFVNSPHKGSVTREMFPFDDVIMSVYFSWVLRQLVYFKNYINCSGFVGSAEV